MTTSLPMYLPTLYKKNKDGSIQFWGVKAIAQRGSDTAYEVYTNYGQVGTVSPQSTHELITEGKNVGKKNATTAEQQAKLLAKQKWTKQLKKGYVDSIEKAEAEELDEVIKGGIEPMLAEKFMEVIYDRRKGHEGEYRLERTKMADKIKFPCFFQPKLDGIRCIAIIKDGKCTLWSRTRKQINSVPHVIEQLEAMFGANAILDGELYNHQLRHDFEKIVSVVRRDKPDLEDPDTYLVQYHIYDCVESGTQEERTKKLNFLPTKFMPNLLRVQGAIIECEDLVKELLDRFVQFGYEGLMFRNLNADYQHDRTPDLQKVKVFDEDEFRIVGINEGKGKMAGKAVFVCEVPDNGTFDVKLEGELDYLKTLFENHYLWTGKKLTVTYQGFTAKGKPRFPVGKAIRDYE